MECDRQEFKAQLREPWGSSEEKPREVGRASRAGCIFGLLSLGKPAAVQRTMMPPAWLGCSKMEQELRGGPGMGPEWESRL